jgi:hypothetical protein
LQTLPAECWGVDFAFRPQKALQLETLFGGLGYPQPPEANSYAGLQVWPLGVTPASGWTVFTEIDCFCFSLPRTYLRKVSKM